MIIEVKKYGQQIHIYHIDQQEFSLGRGDESDYLIQADDISRRHCIIKIEEGKLFIKDLGSLNGTYVNGKRIPSNEDVEFSPKYPIGLGKKIQLFFPDQEPISDLDDFNNNKNMNGVDTSSQTRIFTGLLKKDQLKKSRRKTKYKMPLIVASVLVVCGLSYFFFLEMQETPEMIETPLKKVRAKKNPLPVKEVATHPLLKDIPGKGCFYDEEKKICEALSLSGNQYISLLDSELVVIFHPSKLSGQGDLSLLAPEIVPKYLTYEFILKLVRESEAVTFKPPLKKMTLYGVDDTNQRPLMIVKVSLDKLDQVALEQNLGSVLTNGKLEGQLDAFAQNIEIQEIAE